MPLEEYITYLDIPLSNHVCKSDCTQQPAGWIN
uniref:Uncharacterized protein n=1 Tax=Anguilla anguilla TaxID=7936 RepID=A0A0E9R386_ANGAN